MLAIFDSNTGMTTISTEMTWPVTMDPPLCSQKVLSTGDSYEPFTRTRAYIRELSDNFSWDDVLSVVSEINRGAIFVAVLDDSYKVVRGFVLPTDSFDLHPVTLNEHQYFVVIGQPQTTGRVLVDSRQNAFQYCTAWGDGIIATIGRSLPSSKYLGTEPSWVLPFGRFIAAYYQGVNLPGVYSKYVVLTDDARVHAKFGLRGSSTPVALAPAPSFSAAAITQLMRVNHQIGEALSTSYGILLDEVARSAIELTEGRLRRGEAIASFSFAKLYSNAGNALMKQVAQLAFLTHEDSQVQSIEPGVYYASLDRSERSTMMYVRARVDTTSYTDEQIQAHADQIMHEAEEDEAIAWQSACYAASVALPFNSVFALDDSVRQRVKTVLHYLSESNPEGYAKFWEYSFNPDVPSVHKVTGVFSEDLTLGDFTSPFGVSVPNSKTHQDDGNSSRDVSITPQVQISRKYLYVGTDVSPTLLANAGLCQVEAGRPSFVDGPSVLEGFSQAEFLDTLEIIKVLRRAYITLAPLYQKASDEKIVDGSVYYDLGCGVFNSATFMPQKTTITTRNVDSYWTCNGSVLWKGTTAFGIVKITDNNARIAWNPVPYMGFQCFNSSVTIRGRVFHTDETDLNRAGKVPLAICQHILQAHGVSSASLVGVYPDMAFGVLTDEWRHVHLKSGNGSSCYCDQGFYRAPVFFQHRDIDFEGGFSWGLGKWQLPGEFLCSTEPPVLDVSIEDKTFPSVGIDEGAYARMKDSLAFNVSSAIFAWYARNVLPSAAVEGFSSFFAVADRVMSDSATSVFVPSLVYHAEGVESVKSMVRKLLATTQNLATGGEDTQAEIKAYQLLLQKLDAVESNASDVASGYVVDPNAIEVVEQNDAFLRHYLLEV